MGFAASVVFKHASLGQIPLLIAVPLSLHPDSPISSFPYLCLGESVEWTGVLLSSPPRQIPLLLCPIAAGCF